MPPDAPVMRAVWFMALDPPAIQRKKRAGMSGTPCDFADVASYVSTD